MAAEPIRILIIDDHPAVASGVKHLLDEAPGCEVVGIAGTGQEGFKLVKQLGPAVVLLDLNLPDQSGVQVCSEMKEKYPHVHIIIYTGYDYKPYYNKLLEGGASGILSKSAAPQEIVEMVYAVVQGKTIVPLSLFRELQLVRTDQAKRYWEIDLTSIEHRILELAAKQHTNAAIAGIIHVSSSSIEKYLKRIYEKLGVRNKSEAIAKIESDHRFEQKL